MQWAWMAGSMLLMTVHPSKPPWHFAASGPILFWMDETARQFDQRFPSGTVEDPGTNPAAAQPATNPQAPATSNLNTDNQSKSDHHDQSQ
jgi:hypothetical protein